MDEVRVLFVGLILHMNLTGSNTAVLPDVPKHEETATIYWKGITQAQRIELRDFYVDITGAVSKEGHGIATHDPSFDDDDRVPHLDNVETHHQALARVERHEKIPDIGAYVEYDGGTLSSYEINQKRVRITKTDGRLRCVACGVVWAGVPQKEAITMTFYKLVASGPSAPAPVILRPGDRVVISNADHDPEADPTDHFPHVFKALVGDSLEHHIVALSDAPSCTTAECNPVDHFLADWLSRKHHTPTSHDAHRLIPADCTNSQYP